ncbi:hypothetical protein [Vitiosangium sp. GDMCC 1.1324]|uniref:hypothetical protein n=1 Tax=Vitiosangium sp. (strain GDMCC 1.1324) TaxID=2138576 RepID=UPI00130DDFFA|nr:hypothetical protein [Vitiosangium sp. GDMCC 1.1324]
MAVKVELFNPGTVPWTSTGLALVGSKREALMGLTVCGPWSPSHQGMPELTVEMNAVKNEARSTFTLKLWAGEAGTGGRDPRQRDVSDGWQDTWEGTTRRLLA